MNDFCIRAMRRWDEGMWIGDSGRSSRFERVISWLKKKVYTTAGGCELHLMIV